MSFRVKGFALALAATATFAMSVHASAQSAEQEPSMAETQGAFVSVNGAAVDGFENGTSLGLRIVGKPPVKEWRVELECQRTNIKTHKYSVYKDKGTAKLVDGKFLMNFKKHGSITMTAEEPMALTMQDISPMCAEGTATMGTLE